MFGLQPEFGFWLESKSELERMEIEMAINVWFVIGNGILIWLEI